MEQRGYSKPTDISLPAQGPSVTLGVSLSPSQHHTQHSAPAHGAELHPPCPTINGSEIKSGLFPSHPSLHTFFDFTNVPAFFKKKGEKK